MLNLICGVLTFIPALYVLESPMYLKENTLNASRLYSWIVCVGKRCNSNQEEMKEALQLVFETKEDQSEAIKLVQTTEHEETQ